jgi:hypothetical protein
MSIICCLSCSIVPFLLSGKINIQEKYDELIIND